MITEMAEAHSNMVAGRHTPALWLVSPPAYTQMVKESGATHGAATMMGLPVRVVRHWSLGWELLDTVRAAQRGIEVY